MTDKQIRPPYEIALMHDHILRLEEELQAKEQECEELKKQWEFSVAHKIILEKDYNEQLYKLKQALTEIKEIAKSVLGNGLDEEVDKFELILDKISEVEDE